MSQFRLDTSIIIQLLGQPGFYTHCVSYLFMREQGLAAVEQYHQALVDKEAGCEGCDQKHRNEMDYVKPVIATFVKISRQLHEISPKHLEPLREHIGENLGYQPPTIVLYYKEDGTKRILEF